jgi:hypothetical protein
MAKKRNLSASAKGLAVDPTSRRTATRKALKRLFRGKSPQEWRAEYAGAYDRGQNVGREVIRD